MNLQAALGDDANFSTTVTTSIGTKLSKDSNLSDLTNASTARTNLGVDPAGTDNSTDVTLASVSSTDNYLTINNQEITSGIVPISLGGTGTNTLNNLASLGTHTTGNYVSTIGDAGNSNNCQRFGF